MLGFRHRKSLDPSSPSERLGRIQDNKGQRMVGRHEVGLISTISQNKEILMPKPRLITFQRF
jgi:hypothetical protein